MRGMQIGKCLEELTFVGCTKLPQHSRQYCALTSDHLVQALQPAEPFDDGVTDIGRLRICSGEQLFRRGHGVSCESTILA